MQVCSESLEVNPRFLQPVLCKSICLCGCLSVHVYVCEYDCMCFSHFTVCLSVCVCLLACVCVCACVCLSSCVCLHACLSVFCQNFYGSVGMSVLLSVSMSTCACMLVWNAIHAGL